ncbi:TPR-like protein [Ephemerocybe angulata]|uniref:TPR-like protein n=1 Tax=Ephemerocybe angulata TaxID=980116 RepID=A0A8H6HUY1_9AGAR|nr:TPR-like protein [Tulosesus angulatus]
MYQFPVEGHGMGMVLTGVALYDKFQRTGDLDDITKSISKLRKSVEITPEGHESMAHRLRVLVHSLESRFDVTGDLRDLVEAISVQRKAVELNPDGDADIAMWFHKLGFSLKSLFRRTGDLHALTEAISMHRKAVELTPEGHADIHSWLDLLGFSLVPLLLNTLGSSLESLFQRTGDLNNLNEAISLRRKALELTPEDHADMPSLFQRTGNLTNLTVELTPEDHANMPLQLNFLCSSLESLFQRTGDLNNLNEAISLKRKALELTPQDHADMPMRLSNLGSSLKSLFERTGDLTNLNEAISLKRRALELTPEESADMPLQLNFLGSSLQSLFQRTGDLNNLAEAISIKRKALELTPEGHADMPIRLNNLGSSLLSRFAISIQRKAVELIAEGHASIATWLNNLGYYLELLFERTGDLNNLTEAISAQRKAVALTGEGDVDMPIWLNNLSRTGNLHDLLEAISNQRKAVELTPDGHANMPGFLNNLGSLLESLFKEAISINRKAVEITPNGHAGMPIRLSNLGCSLTSLFECSGDLDNLTEAISKQRKAVKLTSDGHVDMPIWLNNLGSFLENRYTQLRNSSGIPLQAASAALTLDRVDKALEWLEQGRVFFMQVSKGLEAAGSSTRSSWTNMSLSEKSTLAEQARDNLNLARQWENLLEEVRAIPRFESFLKPVPWTTLLQHLPASGPVIIINVDTRRCDAIALLAGQDQPLHIPLPDFSLELCNQYREGLTARLQSFHPRYRGGLAMPASDLESGRGIRPVLLSGKNGETVIQTVLRGLWEKIVQPIFQTLELVVEKSPETTLQRIWWCPTGPLSFLPIHAAGIYGKTGSKSVLDYVISSYIPTVTALTDRVKNSQSIDKEATGLFMTSQPKVDGASHIPGTTTEVRSIYEVVTAGGVRAEKREGAAISAAECLDIMEKYSIVHLACHGSQNAEDPLKSRFLFHDASLELGAIVQRSLKNADLAFLSACETSTGVDLLPDEAVHLAAGMLAAGYQRVVATMWSIGDRDAPAVAKDFYQYLLDHRELTSEAGLDGRFSAHALHHATKQLRLRLDDNSDQSLLTWIPYVHFGY